MCSVSKVAVMSQERLEESEERRGRGVLGAGLAQLRSTRLGSEHCSAETLATPFLICGRDQTRQERIVRRKHKPCGKLYLTIQDDPSALTGTPVLLVDLKTAPASSFFG